MLNNLPIYDFVIVFVVSFLLVLNLTPFIIKMAFKFNFVDNPSARKMHKKVVPLLGGLSVFIGFIAVVLFETLMHSYQSLNKSMLGFLGAGFLVMLIGLIDDKKPIKPKIKFAWQIVVCLIFLYTNNLFTFLGPFWVTVPILMLWMIGLMNAFNFLDNMDGILAGMSGILALGFYAVSVMTKTASVQNLHNYVALVSLSFAGSVFGFLPYNFNPAKLFMGDAGSMFIGYILSTIGILTGKMTVNSMQNNLYFVLPILILSYAVFDISLVSYTRKRDGRRVSQGGKDHSTHRIGTAMGSTKITALMVYLINVIIVLTAIIVLKLQSVEVLIISTFLYVSAFLFFGKKLDCIPIVIPKNQLKDPKVIR
ncbi:MAG: MraY family glycosyltransferase [Candidatus Cloacimonadales bacterium]|jgi:UDP-GlcNAc:undecaprenyl-phosphate GlcNAc-1-phosphate transferase|nr:MraY family glycosyltransferase [Candidatus Cloacimonadales bacterium]